VSSATAVTAGTAVRPAAGTAGPANALARFVREKPLGAFGGVLCVLLLFVAVFADVLAPYGYNETSRSDQLAPPSAQHWFGADQFGRDVLSRTLHGARISMFVGLGAVTGATVLSIALGLITGYFGGWLDNIAQRFVDAWMSFPGLIIALALISWTGPGILQVITVLSLAMGIRNSRVIRGQVLSIKENMYVEAARCIGCTDLTILGRYVLPNIMAPIIILASVELPAAILIEASLSFLGFGVPPPIPSWGQMLASDSRQHMQTAPWMALAPGVALSMAVFGWNVFGDALRDVLDPRLKGAKSAAH
jgi:peptide/nickel transport system permease protein